MISKTHVNVGRISLERQRDRLSTMCSYNDNHRRYVKLLIVVATMDDSEWEVRNRFCCQCD